MDGSEHVFFINDNGVRFNMDHDDRFFGVFQRLHLESEFEGTGTGLVNVQCIIGLHAGRTWVEDFTGHGATFYFTLPMPKELIEDFFSKYPAPGIAEALSKDGLISEKTHTKRSKYNT